MFLVVPILVVNIAYCKYNTFGFFYVRCYIIDKVKVCLFLAVHSVNSCFLVPTGFVGSITHNVTGRRKAQNIQTKADVTHLGRLDVKYQCCIL